MNILGYGKKFEIKTGIRTHGYSHLERRSLWSVLA